MGNPKKKGSGLMKRILSVLALLLLTAARAEAQANSHVLIVSGLGGEPKYVQDFLAWGSAMAEAVQGRFGVPAANVTYLAEEPQRNRAIIDGESRREEIEKALQAIAARAGADDRILILLIGHGSMDSRGSRINLPGPDLLSTELATMLAPFRTQSVVVVNGASASGSWHEALAAPNRTIITATRSGSERNETIFPKFFVEAFSGDGADADRDGRVTVQEAFNYATRETERSYQTAGTLQMERARMEGNTELARTFHLGAPAGQAPSDASPELRALYARRGELENSVDALRNRRSQMEDAAYQTELERLVLELARTNRSIQDAESGAR